MNRTNQLATFYKLKCKTFLLDKMWYTLKFCSINIHVNHCGWVTKSPKNQQEKMFIRICNEVYWPQYSVRDSED